MKIMIIIAMMFFIDTINFSPHQSFIISPYQKASSSLWRLIRDMARALLALQTSRNHTSQTWTNFFS
jgi:hypothetical protein